MVSSGARNVNVVGGRVGGLTKKRVSSPDLKSGPMSWGGEMIKIASLFLSWIIRFYNCVAVHFTVPVMYHKNVHKRKFC